MGHKIPTESVNKILSDFRKVILEIQRENDYLRAKVQERSTQFGETISSTSTNLSQSTSFHITNSTPSPLNLQANHLRSIRPRPAPSNSTSTSSNSSIPPKSNVKSIIEKLTKQKLFADQNSIPKHNQVLRFDLSDKFNNTKTTVKMAAKRGALIVLEGLDRVGKSTLATKLVEHLIKTNKPVAHFRFPDRTTPIGKLIGDLLTDPSKHIDDHAMHLLFSANRWEFNKQIRQTLLKGTNVIIDRYSYSGIAYSCAKRDLSLKWCREVEVGLPKPDLVIYLEVSKETQYGRQGFGDERYEVKELQELIRKEYNNLIESSKEVWLNINIENKGPEQVLGEVILPVKRCIESSSTMPLGDLKF